MNFNNAKRNEAINKIFETERSAEKQYLRFYMINCVLHQTFGAKDTGTRAGISEFISVLS